MNKTLGMILISSLVLSSAFAGKTPSIKVRIANALPKITISGKNINRYIYPSKSRKSYSGKKKINFDCRRDIGSKLTKRPIRLATVKSKSRLLTWDKNQYIGKLHVQTSSKKKGCDLRIYLP